MKRLAVGLTMLLLAFCTKQTVADKGQVELFVGDVTLNGSPVQAGDTVGAGDLIVTGADSYCDIVFDEKNVFHISANSEVSVDFSAAKKIVIRSGGVGFVLGNLNEELFQVETSVAVASVRGTVFDIQVESSNQAYFCTCNGIIAYDTGHGWVTNVTAEHHASLRLLKNADDTVSLLPSALEYHTDEGVEGLAAEIGLRIDWTKVDGLGEAN